jgi:hypothetical protein
VRESKLPPLIRSSIRPEEPMTTSVASPARMRFLMSAMPTHWVSAFTLLERTKAGSSS